MLDIVIRNDQKSKMKTCLLCLFILQILLQCAHSATTNQSNSRKTTQNGPKEIMAEEEQSALASNPGSDKPENQMDEAGKSPPAEKNPANTEIPHQDEETNQKMITTPSTAKPSTLTSATQNAGGNPPPKNNTNGMQNGKDDMNMIKCNSSNECASFVGAECIKNKMNNKTQCLCGNLMSPKTNTSCKDVKRYAKFPCKEPSQCVANADCSVMRANDSHLLLVGSHASAHICLCKKDFEAVKDGSQCLNEVGRLKMEQDDVINKVQKLLKNIQKEQQVVRQRLKFLENSGPIVLPAASLLLISSFLSLR